jgi:hypothetical protein
MDDIEPTLGFGKCSKQGSRGYRRVRWWTGQANGTPADWDKVSAGQGIPAREERYLVPQAD